MDRPVVLPWWYRLAARVRRPVTSLGLLGILAGTVGGLALPDRWLPGGGTFGVAAGGFLLILIGVALSTAPLAPRIAARPVSPPVAGRWRAANSPAGKVPSHGTHGHGQTYAIDLVYEPQEPARPRFGEGPAFRPARDFPGFGQKLYAPADGRVVSVRDTARDHRSRSTRLAYAYLVLEGAVRDLVGSRFFIGNQVVLDLGDGVYAALAHLQRGSAVVRAGQRVRRGEPIGRCGNSGNSSEPHLHFQLMDHPWPYVAAGLPFVFTDVHVDGSPMAEGGVPGNDQMIVS